MKESVDLHEEAAKENKQTSKDDMHMSRNWEIFAGAEIKKQSIED